MKSIELIPRVGAGLVKLGMPRSAVHTALGRPSASFKKVPTSLHPTDAWLSNGFQVFYSGTEPVVEFIELSGGCGFEVLCMGMPAFSTPAMKLVQHFAAYASLAPESEGGCTFEFPSLELSLWRPTDDEAENQFFSTIGIGIDGYFSGAYAAQQVLEGPTSPPSAGPRP